VNPTRKSAIMAVTSDLATDQRVHRNCMALAGMGYEVQLVGRVLPSSPPVPKRSYTVQTIQIAFHQGSTILRQLQLKTVRISNFQKV